jgi:hypothetical protein
VSAVSERPYRPLSPTDGLSEDLREALDERFEALIDEQYKTRAFMIEARDQCVRLADKVLEQAHKLAWSAESHAANEAPPPMRDKVPTLRDIVVEAVAEATGKHGQSDSVRAEEAIERAELKRDAAQWRAIKAQAREATWAVIRKIIGIVLLAAAGWAAGHLEGRATAPPVPAAHP